MIAIFGNVSFSYYYTKWSSCPFSRFSPELTSSRYPRLHCLPNIRRWPNGTSLAMLPIYRLCHTRYDNSSIIFLIVMSKVVAHHHASELGLTTMIITIVQLSSPTVGDSPPLDMSTFPTSRYLLMALSSRVCLHSVRLQ